MADNQVAEKWEWFCGPNSTDLELFANWERDQALNNTCLVDAFVAGPHSVALLVFSLVLFLIGCCTKYRNQHSRYLVRFPGHSFKWLIASLLFVVLFASLGEGVLTDQSYRIANDFNTQPHFYIPPVMAMVALALSLIFYQMMEVWQLPYMAFLLIIYWLVSIVAEVTQLLNILEQTNLDNIQDLVDVMKFDLIVCRLIFYSFLLLLDINVVRAKVR